MEAKELRLGNIIRHVGTGDNKTVTPNTILDCWEYPHKYEPIPLSAEIFEKFEQLIADNYGVYFFKGSEICCKLTNGVLQIGMWNYKNEDNKMPIICELKHVHQLQNAFHSLTQTELNITL